MVRRTNFAHIAVRGDTKKRVDELKKKIEEDYHSATYDELLEILLEKHNRIILSKEDIKKILGRIRGISI